MRIPFDVNNPPATPPIGCLEPEKWGEAYSVLRQHESNPYGHGANKHCGARYPCFAGQVALRTLIDSCTPKQQMIPPEPGHIATRDRCQWCGQSIAFTVWGWLHMQGGFILCRDVPE